MNHSNLPPGVTDRMIEEQACGPNESKKNGHTPGPWKNPSMEFPHPYYIRAAENGGMNAYIAQINCGRPEAVANGRVIEAAPDFYEACGGDMEPGLDRLSWAESILKIAAAEGWQALVKYDANDPDAMAEALQNAVEMCAQLKAAMAKAKGR